MQGHIGDKLTAGKTLTRMLALTQKSGDGVGEIYGLLEQGRLSDSLNNTAQAQKSSLSALEKARGLSNGWLKLLALYRVANSYYQETKLAEAQKVATQGGELSKAEGYWQ